jgi:hypothetical protein
MLKFKACEIASSHNAARQLFKTSAGLCEYDEKWLPSLLNIFALAAESCCLLVAYQTLQNEHLHPEENKKCL